MDRGKEDCKQAAQANRLTLVLGQKGGKADLGSGNPRAQRSEADGKAHKKKKRRRREN